MNCFLTKSFRAKPSAARVSSDAVLRRATAVSTSTQQLRSYGSSSEPNEDERMFPVYVHPVSKVVLQHLQDSRSGWLANQGLNRGLQLKSNGAFLLNFPGRKGSDAGKIWTSHDPATNKHWLIVYRNKFNAKYLLAEGQYEEGNGTKAENIEAMSIDNEVTRQQIQSAVDKMVRLLPPPANAKY